MAIDWTNPSAKISQNFVVKEALWLPQWSRLANTTDGFNIMVQDNLVDTFKVLDKIRILFGKPVSVHCAYRPQAYNILVGGAPRSAHILGKAIDFSIQGVNCDAVRANLLPKLKAFGLRMENNPGSNWVHIDTMPTDEKFRYFKP